MSVSKKVVLAALAGIVLVGGAAAVVVNNHNEQVKLEKKINDEKTQLANYKKNFMVKNLADADKAVSKVQNMTIQDKNEDLKEATIKFMTGEMKKFVELQVKAAKDVKSLDKLKTEVNSVKSFDKEIKGELVKSIEASKKVILKKEADAKAAKAKKEAEAKEAQAAQEAAQAVTNEPATDQTPSYEAPASIPAYQAPAQPEAPASTPAYQAPAQPQASAPAAPQTQAPISSGTVNGHPWTAYSNSQGGLDINVE